MAYDGNSRADKVTHRRDVVPGYATGFELLSQLMYQSGRRQIGPFKKFDRVLILGPFFNPFRT